MPRYIASIDADPPLGRIFDDDREAAIAWAKKNAAGRAWGVGEVPADGPPRIIASGLPDDVE